MSLISDLYELLRLKTEVKYKLDDHHIVTEYVSISDVSSQFNGSKKIKFYGYPGNRIRAGKLYATTSIFDLKKNTLEEIAAKIYRQTIKRHKVSKLAQAEEKRKRESDLEILRKEMRLKFDFHKDLSAEDLEFFCNQLRGEVEVYHLQEKLLEVKLILHPEELVRVIKLIKESL